MKNFIEVVDYHATTKKDDTIYSFLDESQRISEKCSFLMLQEKAKTIASFLLDTYKPGDRILLSYPPGLEFIYAFMGCMYAGIIAVPVFPPVAPEMERKLKRVIKDAEPVACLTDGLVASLMQQCNSVHNSLTTMHACGEYHGVSLIRTDNLPAHWQGRFQYNNDIDPETILFLQYTSGSTGDPKGVAVTHGNITTNEQMIAGFFESIPESRVVGWLPMYHDMGLIGNVLQPCFKGYPAVLFSPQHFLKDPLSWLEIITKYKATISGGPNFGYDLCIKKADPERMKKLDLTSWELAFNGAEPIRKRTLDLFSATFASCGFRKEALYPCYGLAENTLIVAGGTFGKNYTSVSVEKESLTTGSARLSQDPQKESLDLISSGRTASGQEIKIVNPDSLVSCSDQTIGEIWVKGNSVASGYWKRPEQSKKTFGEFTSDGEGPFLRTGDLGFFYNEDLYVSGRIKDVIIINGRNYYPSDIEYTIENNCSSVRGGRTAAFAIEKDGVEKIIVVAEYKGDGEPSNELYSSIRTDVSRDHGLGIYHIVLIEPYSIAVTTSGKIRRQATKQMYLDETLSRLASSKIQRPHIPSTEKGRNQLEEEIQQIIASIVELPVDEIHNSAPLGQYGLTSIAVVQIAGELEKLTDREVTPATVFAHPTVKELAAYICGDAAMKITMNETSTEREPIAVIGLGCRLPGSEDSLAFWENLTNEMNLITEIPDDRTDLKLFAAENQDGHARGGFINDIKLFDPDFFGMSDAEAVLIDPQHRKFLEAVWAALEDAGYPPSALGGTNTGVFAGISTFDYNTLMTKNEAPVSVFSATGSAFSMLANRLSYILNLRGPSETIDTACSSSLVALHKAITAMYNGDCEQAIVGGVNALIVSEGFEALKKGGFLSSDGLCKTFDDSANGYVRGEGAGVVILKPLSKAIEDDDQIYGVIKGSMVSHGGRTASLTAPGEDRQAELLVKAYKRANIPVDTVSYIEAHGTGTALGDPIEINALKKAFTALGCSTKHTCGIGSVKTNIGHLEAASGIAGLIKVLLSLKHKTIPATINFNTLNTYIDIETSPFYIADRTARWNGPETDDGVSAPLRAGISSFGFGGSYAHVVLEDYNQPLISNESDEPDSKLFVFSAKTVTSLESYMKAFLGFINKQATTSQEDISLSDIACSLQRGREHYDRRLAIIAGGYGELKKNIGDWLNGSGSNEKIFSVAASKNSIVITEQPDLNDPATLAQKWVSGESVDWHMINKTQSYQQVSLPPYQFDQRELWINEIATSPVERDAIQETDDSVAILDLDSVTQFLKEKVADITGLEPDEFGTEDNFTDLDVSSIALIEIISDISDVYGVEVSTAAVQECPDIGSFADYIIHGESESVPDLYNEALLDDDITFSDLSIDIEQTAKEILLTGATGFLGIFLLRELLLKTEARVHCLVRAKDSAFGLKRLQSIMENFMISDCSFNGRVNVIAGDLTEHQFGLEHDAFETLSKTVDTVYHCGAVVDWMKPYVSLKETNVFGTEQVLRFAGTNRLKPVHYISSLGILPLTGESRNWLETDLPSPENLTNGYAQSKWVSEMLCHEARKRGLPISIYRFDYVAGAIETGAMKDSDFIVRLIKGCIQLGCIPNEEVNFDIVSVDYLSRIIVEISGKARKINKTYHLINRQPFLTSDFVTLIRNFGYKVEKIPLALWKTHVENSPDSVLFPLYPFINKYDTAEFDQYYHSTIDNTNTLTALFDIDENYITAAPSAADVMQQVIRYFIRIGYIPSADFKHVLERQKNYWQNELADAPILDGLPTDKLSQVDGVTAFQRVGFKLRSELGSRLDMLCTSFNVDRACVLLAVYNVLLLRYSNQSDITVAVPYSETCISDSGKSLYTSKMTFIRSRLGANEPFKVFLRTLIYRVSEALANMDVESDYISSVVPCNSNETCDISFFYQSPDLSTKDRLFNAAPLTRNDIWQKTGTLQLSVLEMEAASADCEFVFPENSFQTARVESMAEHFVNLLTEICISPEKSASEFQMLDEQNYKQVVYDWNTSEQAYPLEKTVHSIFREHAEHNPDRTAIRFNNEKMSYGELNIQSDNLAVKLVELGVNHGDIVAVSTDRSFHTIVAMMGILKSGAAYLPIDPSLPEKRFNHMLVDSGTSLVLTQTHLMNINNNSNVTFYCMDVERICNASQSDIKALQSAQLQWENSKQPAYMIYTSGSTGLPKGAVLQHRGFANALFSFNRNIQLKEQQSFLALTSISFDASVWEIFLPLVTGATIELVTKEMAQDGYKLKKRLTKTRVSAMFATPATWRMLEFAGYKGDPDMVIATGGEALPENLAGRLLTWGSRVYNCYGPTETSIAVTSVRVKQDSAVTIGRPMANATVYVLDRFQNPLPVGVAGELYASGEGVGLGYYNKPEMTDAAFIPNPFHEKYQKMYKTGDLVRYLPDGDIEYLGRVDHQVKIRGFRIELGEIESLILQDKQIRECAVVVKEGKRIIAYVVPEDQAGFVDFSVIDEVLSEKLPDYMLVNDYHVMNQFPLNNSGKIDRAQLPEPADREVSDSFNPPVTPAEKQLAEIWKHAIETDIEIGACDNFLDIGGNSIVAVRVLSEINKQFGIELTVQELFDNLTIEELALAVLNSDTREFQHIGRKGKIDFHKEAELDFDFNFETLQPAVPVSDKISAIFLTGATGFLGAFLVSELLDKTEADLYCLVRAKNEEEGLERLRKNLETYILWKEEYSYRIIPVPGDLMKPSCGLSEETFDELGRLIDVVYHNGSIANFAYPYSFLKKANVDGTREMIRLAGHIKVKQLHYVSTIGVFESPDLDSNATIMERDKISSPDELFFGYSQTKWVAEKMVSAAGEKGLPVTIFRPALILADTGTGASNLTDIMNYTIRACGLCGCLPDLDFEINGVPVDYVARALVDISLQPEVTGEIIHISNSKAYPIRQIISTFSDIYDGFPVVDPVTWMERISKEAEKNESLAQIATAVKNEINLMNGQRLPAFSLETTVLFQPDYINRLPVMGASYWHNYFHHLIEIDYLSVNPEKVTSA